MESSPPDVVLFGDADLDWEEPTESLAVPRPPRPSVVRRGRRQTRTLASDLACLRGAVLAHARSFPPRAWLVFACATLGVVAVGVALAGRGDGDREPAGSTSVAPRIPPTRSRAFLVPEHRVLRFGDRGPAVRALQRALARLRFDPGPADGIFATATRAAVMSFQQSNGLTMDGILGPQTARALNDPGARAAQPGLPTPGATDPPDAAAVRSELAAAVTSGRLSRRDAARYDAVLDRFLVRLSESSGERAVTLAAVLRDVSVHSAVYDEPRALALFRMLETNARYLTRRDPPETMTDVAGGDGAVHRFVAGHGFQIHPLANFARLNALVAAGERVQTDRLARAAVARAVRRDGALTWEYYFPFKGPSRWTSGMAQAVAAQALARTAALLDERELAEAARGAYAAIPGKLVRPLAGGLWLREYGFSDIAILNSQLQAVLSVSEYAELTDDAEARHVAEQLATATRTLLPRFDTGCWSLYSLDGSEASLSYQLYVVSMLRKLAAKRPEPAWGQTAKRWKPTRLGPRCAAR